MTFPAPHRALLAFLAACWLALAVSPAAAEPRLPALSGRVVDEAGLLSEATRGRIDGWLERFEADTGRQVVVVTVKSLQGYGIEEFGVRLGRVWGIGEKDKNTGALLLVAPNERTVRIEVGYGLEGELTDATSRAIIDREILPAFRQGDMQGGIMAGTAAILRALGWDGADAARRSLAPQPALEDMIPFGVMVLIFLFVLLRFGWRGVWILGMGQNVWGGRSRGSFGDRGGFSGGGGSFGGGGATGKW